MGCRLRPSLTASPLFVWSPCCVLDLSAKVGATSWLDARAWKQVEQSEYRTPPCSDRTVDSKCCMASPLHAAATEVRAFRDDAGGHKLSGVRSGLMHVDKRSATYTGKVPVRPVHRKCTRQTRGHGLPTSGQPKSHTVAWQAAGCPGDHLHGRGHDKLTAVTKVLQSLPAQSGPPALAQTPAQNPAPLSAAQDARMRASSKPSRHA